MFCEEGRVNQYLSSAMCAFHLEADPWDGKDSPGRLKPSSACLGAMAVGIPLVAKQLRKFCAHALFCGDAPVSPAFLPQMKRSTKFW